MFIQANNNWVSNCWLNMFDENSTWFYNCLSKSVHIILYDLKMTISFIQIIIEIAWCMLVLFLDVFKVHYFYKNNNLLLIFKIKFFSLFWRQFSKFCQNCHHQKHANFNEKPCLISAIGFCSQLLTLHFVRYSHWTFSVWRNLSNNLNILNSGLLRLKQHHDNNMRYASNKICATFFLPFALEQLLFLLIRFSQKNA